MQRHGRNMSQRSRWVPGKLSGHVKLRAEAIPLKPSSVRVGDEGWRFGYPQQHPFTKQIREFLRAAQVAVV